MINRLSYIGLCLFLLVACNEVIDLDTEEVGGQVVIDGNINNGTFGNEVRISRTQPYGVAPEPITGLLVKVNDDLGNCATLQEQQPGVYRLVTNEIRREAGRSIWMNFEFQGKTYQSNPQTMQELIAKDSISWDISLEKDISPDGAAFEEEVVRVYANTTFYELPEEFYLRWKVEEVYNVLEAYLPPQNFTTRQAMCFITNDLSEQEIFLLNGEKIRNLNLQNRELVARRVDRSFSLKHYFNLIQMSMTKESHDYWEKVNSLTARSGSIFDTPPAEIQGNVSSSDPDEVVLGIFDVVKIDTARTLLTNDDILYFFENPCNTVGAAIFYRLLALPYGCRECVVDEGIMPRECIDCLTINNSSFRRPSYF